MLTIRTNIAAVSQALRTKLSAAIDKDRMLRSVAVGLLPVVKTRIHEHGRDATDQLIGVYKDSYMKVRKRLNRTDDKMVVVSLRRQLENDFSVIPTETGYGLGYNNPFNRLKMGYVEEHFKKKIAALTETEKNMAGDIAAEVVSNTFKA